MDAIPPKAVVRPARFAVGARIAGALLLVGVFAAIELRRSGGAFGPSKGFAAAVLFDGLLGAVLLGGRAEAGIRGLTILRAAAGTLVVGVPLVIEGSVGQATVTVLHGVGLILLLAGTPSRLRIVAGVAAVLPGLVAMAAVALGACP